MASPLDPQDVAFVLYDVLDVETLTQLPAFAGHARETFDAALATAERLALDKFLPHNRKADLNPPRLENGRLVLIPEIAEAVRAFDQAGFTAAHFPEERGGMGLPWCVAQACFAWFQAANIATTAYPFLTIAAANLLEAFATPEQKRRWLEPLLEGRFSGTMAMSEPQAGSSLGEIRTTATPLGNGRYSLRGSKMWISGAANDFSETVVNLMLARVEGAPPGVRGLSLFIVPRDRVDDDGRVTGPNAVTVAGLNHKMGYRGTTNSVLSLGEQDGCEAELLGAEGQGLACMFHMMNEARIGVGMGAAMLAYAGFRASLDYARGRPQGRHADQKDPTSPQVPLVEHADVRRLLLQQKAVAEGGLLLGLYAARLVDEAKHLPGEADRHRAHLLLDILTPILKAHVSDRAVAANDAAIQVLGGYGYTLDFPVEQLWRDNRLNPIHEGANAIQAIDLLGRKVALEDGAAFAALVEAIKDTLTRAAAEPELRPMARTLETALARLRAVTATLLDQRKTRGERAFQANASVYLALAGSVVLAWMWLWQALVACRRLRAEPDHPDADRWRGKLHTCRYVLAHELAPLEGWAGLLERFDDTTLAMRPAWL
jgi:butyryl-CoA dehydrogenase